MTESSQNETIAASVEVPIPDPHGWEEPEAFTVRQRLGLRPIFYPLTEAPVDQECPDWCWRATCEGGVHETDHENPFVIQHQSDSIEMSLSRYSGDKVTSRAATGEELRGVQTETLDVRIKQDSDTDAAEIWLQLGGEPTLVLSPDDACDLITILGHFVGRIDANERLNGRERNAFEIGREVGRERSES